ncbi:DUF5518 domain-containing protein [Halomicrobium salinisoli]|uniref:DUF5518 domain-containing protein n=1 Tax=Halomicrobium salinisoli TaxID=2878391 RepID=UPI001CF0BC65|nr:DUF5518 domain-containing protein [Halomicrobium salinisoli]
MVPSIDPRRRLRRHHWCALFAGLLMLPLIADQALQMTGDYDFDMWPVFYAGLIVGLLYDGPSAEAKRAGIWAGVLASLPAYAALAWMAVTHVGSDPSITTVAPALLVVVVASVAFLAFDMLIGLLGALLGRWIAGKLGRPRLPVVSA